MKKTIAYISQEKIELILDGANPNGNLFADPDRCFEAEKSSVCQAVAIVKLSDLENIIHKLKTIEGIAKAATK